ncbi:MAG: hypothetical protein HY275_08485 [Gemmatimonadetes bacterium]|nr:hypothetical protein [Gemmatimonadota bacterium]
MTPGGLRVRASLVAGTAGTLVLRPANAPATAPPDAHAWPADPHAWRELPLDEALGGIAPPAGRLVIAELPDDDVHRPLARALEARGFVREGQIADYVDRGVDLLILRKELT